jgi:hypothetical protein
MATSSTFTVAGGVSVTRIDSHDQLPQIAGTPNGLRKSNQPACGCLFTCDYPPANVGTDTVQGTNRFPTAALAAGVYRS